MTRRTGISTAPTARGGATSLLTVESLCKRFGGLQALDHLSFAVSTGEVLGIIGPNGAGKTALINCITGLYQADSGAIGLDGTDLSNRAPHQISRLGIARTFQNIRLFRRHNAHCARCCSGLTGRFESQRCNCLIACDWRTRPICWRVISPMARRGDWKSRGRLRPVLVCCFSTNRLQG